MEPEDLLPCSQESTEIQWQHFVKSCFLYGEQLLTHTPTHELEDQP